MPYTLQPEAIDPTKGRLELTWSLTGPSKAFCAYELVLPLQNADCRGTFDHRLSKKRPKDWRRIYLTKANEIRVPLGRTEVNGSADPRFCLDGSPSTPFRDGAHVQWDSIALNNLPAYVIIDSNSWRLVITSPGKS